MAETERRVAVVTRSASDSGAAVAERLAGDGWDLALTDSDGTGLQRTVDRCRAVGPDVAVVSATCDPTDRLAVEGAAEAMATELGVDSIQLLVNLPGPAGGASFVVDDDESWERTFDGCWGATYRMTRAFLPLLRSARSADVVNVVGPEAVWPFGVHGPTTARASASAAVRGFTEALQRDLAAQEPSLRAHLVVSGGDRVPAHEIAEAIQATIGSGRWRTLVGADAVALDRAARLLPPSRPAADPTAPPGATGGPSAAVRSLRARATTRERPAPRDVAGRLAVVTGAGSGIGRALAEHLARDGADLALCDVDADSLATTVERCRGHRSGVVVSSMVVDVRDRGALDRFASHTLEQHATASVDLLFNNAGIGGGESFLTSDEDEWDRTFEISWWGTYRTTRAFLPMLRASSAADIVCVSSINGIWAELGHGAPVSAYATAKFTVRAFAESLQRDLQQHAPHVRSIVVMPGAVSSRITSNTLAMHGRDPVTMSAARLQLERERLQERGVDLSGLDDDGVRRRLIEWNRAFDDRASLSPDQAADAILAGVRAGARRVLVGPDAVAIERVARWMPDRLYELSTRRLVALMTVAAPGTVVVGAARAGLDRRRGPGSDPTAAVDQTGAMPQRSALVTGSSTGIGEATALALDALGWRVFAGVRRVEDGERLQEKASDRLVPVLIDVTDADQIAEALATVGDELGPAGLDALVNNAGVSFGGPIEIVPLDHWRQQLEVNVVGQVAVTQAALPLIRKAYGRIVFISSLSGRVAPAYIGPYAASKFALEGVAMSLRKELIPWGIRVAVIEPGVIDTPIWHKAPDAAEIERTFPKEGIELYAPYLLPLQGLAEKQLEAGAPMSEATDAIVHALTADHPRHRYLVGNDAKLLATMYRVLPDRVAGKAERLMWRFKF